MHLPVRLAFLPLAIAVAIAAEEKSGGLPKRSPFDLRNGSAAPTAAASETIEFAGVSSIGKKTDLIFYDKTAKKSHWIPPGETKEGISVISYDERRDEAVVKVNGVQKTLALRKAAPTTGVARGVAPVPTGFNTPLPPPLTAPVPAQVPVPGTLVTSATPTTQDPAATPPAPPPGSPAEVQKKQETEARMLVSDLLEIGMAQRKAYEEAQRKAAEGQPPNASGGTATDSSPSTPPAAGQPSR